MLDLLSNRLGIGEMEADLIVRQQLAEEAELHAITTAIDREPRFVIGIGLA